MAGSWRNAMVMLGFTDDATDYDPYADELDELAQPRERYGRESQGASVAPLRRVPDRADVVHQLPVGALSRITTVHPTTYNDAQQIGADFREGIPVIMDLSDLSETDAKRLVDFAAGLVYGLEGAIDRVTRNVFLLSPAHVDVNGYEGAGEAGRDLFNQS